VKPDKEKEHRKKLFQEFFAWTELTEDQFESKTTFTRGWIRKCKNGQQMTLRSIAAMKRIFNVPEAYWEGKAGLPIRKEDIIAVAEPSAEYLTEMKIKDMRIAALMEENMKLKDKVIILQEELLRFQALAKSH